MVSVAFAIWLFPLTPERPSGPPVECLMFMLQRIFTSLNSKRRASLRGVRPRLGFNIAWHWAGADPDDVDDVSSLSEPHGFDRAMADRGRACAEISQPGPARRLRQTVRTAGRGAGADLAHLAHLCAPGLRHRKGDGWQSGTRGGRRGRLQ